MNIDPAYEMYRRLLASMLDHVDFTADTSYRLKKIAEERHCGDGYFSFDGILDDLTEIFGYNLASDILNNA